MAFQSVLPLPAGGWGRVAGAIPKPVTVVDVFVVVAAAVAVGRRRRRRRHHRLGLKVVDASPPLIRGRCPSNTWNAQVGEDRLMSTYLSHSFSKFLAVPREWICFRAFWCCGNKVCQCSRRASSNRATIVSSLLRGQACIPGAKTATWRGPKERAHGLSYKAMPSLGQGGVTTKRVLFRDHRLSRWRGMLRSHGGLLRRLCRRCSVC